MWPLWFQSLRGTSVEPISPSLLDSTRWLNSTSSTWMAFSTYGLLFRRSGASLILGSSTQCHREPIFLHVINSLMAFKRYSCAITRLATLQWASSWNASSAHRNRRLIQLNLLTTSWRPCHLKWHCLQSLITLMRVTMWWVGFLLALSTSLLESAEVVECWGFWIVKLKRLNRERSSVMQTAFIPLPPRNHSLNLLINWQEITEMLWWTWRVIAWRGSIRPFFMKRSIKCHLDTSDSSTSCPVSELLALLHKRVNNEWARN